MIFKGKNNEFLQLEKITPINQHLLLEKIDSGLSILWIKEDNTVLKIDNIQYTFHKNQIISLTEFHSLDAVTITELCLVKFNRPFYCILHNDSEVGCKGLLFFGASQVPVINLPYEEIEKFEILWKMFCIEMESKDDLQIEMLQMMLKRLLILCTRIYKEQNEVDKLDSQNIDLIREFNILIESHFRHKHSVAEYAELLNKSPKTLSNLFSKVYQKSPLQYIHDRILLEAKRNLIYSEKPIKEIAYELGFEDLQSFSRFFKAKENISPKDFKQNNTKEKLTTL